MSRGAKLSPYLGVDDGGFTMTSFKKGEIKSQSVSSWTHFYHEPYMCDWREARRKAKERKVMYNE